MNHIFKFFRFFMLLKEYVGDIQTSFFQTRTIIFIPTVNYLADKISLNILFLF